jgi:hypothetical protein
VVSGVCLSRVKANPGVVLLASWTRVLDNKDNCQALRHSNIARMTEESEGVVRNIFSTQPSPSSAQSTTNATADATPASSSTTTEASPTLSTDSIS